MPDAGFTPAPQFTSTAPTQFSSPHTQPYDDVLELLPVAAQDRPRKLRQRRDDAAAVTIKFDAIHESSMGRISAEDTLSRLTRRRGDRGGFGLAADDARVLHAAQVRDKTADDFARLTALQEARTVTWQAASGALASVEDWLKTGRPGNTLIEAFDGPEPALKKGEGLLDGVERVRRRVRELKADLHRIACAPYPSAYAKKRAREQIEQLAQRGAADVTNLIEHDLDIGWPSLNVRSQVFNAAAGAVAFHEAPDVVGTFAWLHRDALIARLDALVDQEKDDAAAMSHEDRQRRTAETQADLLACERDEAALTWRAQSERLPIEHRADCHPCAILQVQLLTRPHAPTPGTSISHVLDVVLAGGR